MIKETFKETNKEYKMINPGDRVLVGVSGGADSIALLYLLASCQKELKISLHVAHLNHLIRKGDAELDVRFVQNLAQRLGVPITVESFDVPTYAKDNKLGLEQAARLARYDFFERIAKKIRADKIAVAHNADDNVETFLMRLLRGSGLKGLCGIPPKRGKIVRPFIKVWRREIVDYVTSLKLVPRQDYTNYESKYMRNRVRLKLIPQLKIYNLNIKQIVLQTILLLTEDREYLETKAETTLSQALLSEQVDELRLDLVQLRKLEFPILGHLLRLGIEKIKGDLLDLAYVHIHEIAEKLNDREKWELHLPGGIFVRGLGNELSISRKKPEPSKKKYYHSFSVPGEINIPELGLTLKATLQQEFAFDEVVKAEDNVAYVSFSALGSNIIVRNRQEGDRFAPLGLKGTKKLQDFFVDQKIPEEERNNIPIVESNGKVVWVAGFRLDDRAKVTKRTKKVVKLELL